MKTCPFCAEEVHETAVVCPHCRSNAQAEPLITELGVPRPAGAGAPVWIIVAVMLGGVGLLTAICMTGMLVPAFQRPRVSGPGTRCRNNLKQIGLALHNYHDVHGTFPPAYIADEDGRPMHSWRVLILPFLDQAPLYQQYDFDEPWDGPNNSLLLDSIPAVYQCPSSPGSTTTSYAAVVGENCIFRGSEPLSIRDITDGTSNTIMVGEAVFAAIPWMAPDDLDFEEVAGININDTDNFTSDHAVGVHVLFADGSVHFLAETLDFDTLMRLLQFNDGKPVGEF